MSRYLSVTLLLALFSNLTMAKDCPETLDFSLRPLAEQTTKSLCDEYAGKVLLIVNTASRCGFTPQYDGLEALYESYRERGLVVLGFPSNDFAQELGTEEEIQSFCRLTYDVKFPMFEKIKVTGDSAHPLYKLLASQGNGYPRWNFHKYLIDRKGNVVSSFATTTRPQDEKIIAAIEQLL